MSNWKVAIEDRHGKVVYIDCGADVIKAGAVAFEWTRIRAGRSVTTHPALGIDGSPIGLIAGRDIKYVRMVETP